MPIALQSSYSERSGEGRINPVPGTRSIGEAAVQ